MSDCAILVVVSSFLFSMLGASVGLVLGHVRLFVLLACSATPVLGASTSLAISAAGAFAGTIAHWRAGRISWRLAATIGVPSAIGGFTGARLAGNLQPQWLELLIAMMLVVSGIELLRSREELDVPNRKRRPPALMLEVAVGLVLGCLAGLVGLMLGSLRLPLLIRALGVDERKAVGTNLTIGCATAMLGAAGAWAAGHIDADMIAVAAPATVIGGYLGSRFSGRMSRATLRRAIGATVIGVGVLTGFKGLFGG